MQKIIDLSAVNPNYFGGVRAFSLDLSREMKRQDPSVKFIVSNDNKEFLQTELRLSPNDIHYIVKNSTALKAIMGFFSLISYLLSSYKLYEFGIYFVGVLFGKLTLDEKKFSLYVPTTNLNFVVKSKKSILSVHDIQHLLMPQNFSFWERVKRKFRTVWSVRLASTVQVSSKYMLHCITENLNVAHQKFEVINEFNRFSKKTKCQKFDKNKTKLRILYPANFWPHKNHEIIFNSLQNINYEIDFKLILTGNDFGKFKTIFEGYDFECEYLGVISDDELVNQYEIADILLMASSHESSSLPIIEGYGFGCQVIACDIEPAKEFDSDFQIILFDIHDNNSLMRAIKTALENLNFSQPRDQLAFDDSYGIESIAKKYLELMER